MFNWDNKNVIKSLLLIGLFGFSQAGLTKDTGYYGYGKSATQEEIAAWDIDVRPDGKGLPVGSGSVSYGEELYEAKCALCHGAFGEGEGRWPKLAGGFDTLTDAKPEKTVGSYWPYASTLWDYIHRAMPFTAPQSLSVDETYALTAYVLYLNDIIDDEDFVLSKDNFTEIEMPNKDGFFVDPRPDVKNPACMENCKDPATIKVTSAIKGITPLQHIAKEEGANDKASSDSEDQQPKSADQVAVDNELKVGSAIYSQSCSICHGSGIAGAPKFGDKMAWAPRIKQGVEQLNKHAIEGYSGKTGIMPAKGGNPSLTDAEVSAAILYMIENSQ
jgi:cytochrome c